MPLPAVDSTCTFTLHLSCPNEVLELKLRLDGAGNARSQQERLYFRVPSANTRVSTDTTEQICSTVMAGYNHDGQQVLYALHFLSAFV